MTVLKSTWANLTQRTTDAAHISEFAHLLGHTEGFCIACAEIYRSLAIALTSQMLTDEVLVQVETGE